AYERTTVSSSSSRPLASGARRAYGGGMRGGCWSHPIDLYVSRNGSDLFNPILRIQHDPVPRIPLVLESLPLRVPLFPHQLPIQQHETTVLANIRANRPLTDLQQPLDRRLFWKALLF